MEDVRFDGLARIAADGGRRSLLKVVGGGLAGTVLSMWAAAGAAGDSRGRRHPKTQRGRSLKAQAKEKPPKDCCCSCPPTSNPCTFPVCDASTGACVEIPVPQGTRCGPNAHCEHDFCTPCDGVIGAPFECPDQIRPNAFRCSFDPTCEV
jgi:hypothetical protein